MNTRITMPINGVMRAFVAGFALVLTGATCSSIASAEPVKLERQTAQPAQSIPRSDHVAPNRLYLLPHSQGGTADNPPPALSAKIQIATQAANTVRSRGDSVQKTKHDTAKNAIGNVR